MCRITNGSKGSNLVIICTVYYCPLAKRNQKTKIEKRKSKNENRKTKNENRKTKGKNQKSTNKFLDKIEKRKSKVENRKTKIDIFFRDSEPVDFFCQRVFFDVF